MKIINLQSENIKRLRAVEITPQGNIVVIGGENAQGKTSVLDSIFMALGGKSSIPKEPIHRGEDSAMIRLELDDLIVTRSFTPTNTYLKVENKEGASFKSPQAMLDKLVGRLSFDPMDFLRMKPKEQHKTLKDIVGLDFTEQDTKRERIYNERRDCNRDIEKMKGTIALKDFPPDTPDEPIDVEGLMEEAKQARLLNANNESQRRQLVVVKDGWVETAGKIDKKNAELKAIKADLLVLRDELEVIRVNGEVLDKEVKELKDVDLEPIDSQIRNSNEINIAVRNKQEQELYKGELKDLTQEAKELTDQIKEIDAEKEKALNEAEFPVPGLSFDENGVTYNGIPFDQASGMEQTKVSLGMGIALNPELRVLLVREASVITPKSLEAIAEFAKEKDVQLWLEDCRATEDQASVIIEDGSVKPKGGK